MSSSVPPLPSAQMLRPGQLAAAVAACNLGTIIVSHCVREEPAPTAVGLAAALAAVAAGTAFKLLPGA